MSDQICLDFKKIKEISEAKIKKFGGEINKDLPLLEYAGIRNSSELIYRATIMSGMIYIAFEAPTKDIGDWIKEQGLYEYVSEWEKSILNKNEAYLTKVEKLHLNWYVESLWMLVWVLGINNEFKFIESVGDNLINMVPDIKKNQNFTYLEKSLKLKPKTEIYNIADLYYRTHWFVVDSRLKGKILNSFNECLVIERRKVLEWVINPSVDWDDIDLST
ncbi:DUF4272 domain-containing protein [Gottfriedia sp. S16(2024)]|uniref:DUF4272 domain-containing protein n=1 Tax=Gottfriedia sp. S16(2024) TaxID=3162883 RepID=UPI003D1F4928